jgi:hypothetical protein
MAPQDADPFVLVQQRRARRMRVIKLAVALLALYAVRTSAYWLSPSYSRWENGLLDPAQRERALSAAETEAIRNALAEADRTAAKAQEDWRKGIAVAIAEGGFSCPDLGAGSHAMPAPTKYESRFGPSWLSVTEKPGDAALVKPALVVRLEAKRQQITGDLEGHYTKQAAARFVEEVKDLSTSKFWTWDVLFVVDRQVHAVITGTGMGAYPGSFEPGKVDGRAYLYDYRAGKVVCSAKVHAESSNRLAHKTVTAREAMDNDLNAQTWQAIGDAMRYLVWPAP